MDELRKQMRELSLEMYEIDEKIKSAKASELPDKIKNLAIEELNERYGAKFEEFRKLEIEYNTAEYMENSAAKAEKYNNLRAQRAQDNADFNKKVELITKYASQDPSASNYLRSGASIDDVYKKYQGQIDVFERNLNKEQQPIYEQPTVAGNENAGEPSVGVSEIVIPDMPSENVALDASAVQNNNEPQATMEQAQTDNVENTTVDNVASTENQDKIVMFDSSKNKDSDFQEVAAAEANNNSNTTESPVEEQEKSNDEVKTEVDADAVREDASEEHKELTDKSQKNLKDFKGFFADLAPEGRRKVKSIAIGGTVVLGAVGLVAAAVTGTLIPAAIVGVTTGVGTYLHSQFKQGQQAPKR